MEDVVYDGFSFVDAGCILTNIDHLTLPTRTNQVVNRANRDGAVLVQSQLGTKPIVVEGYYSGSSAIDAQNMYDTLAAALNRQERILVVPHAGSTRSYTATPESVILQEPNGLNRLTFSMQFVVPDGNSFSDDDIQIINDTFTTAANTSAFTIVGSVNARPLITITFTSVTGGTSKVVSIRNARNFVGLTFSRTFSSGDVITIDSANYQIYINGVLTNPVGRMPSWAPGSGALVYGDTFTSRNVTITATYQRKDL